MDELDSLPSDKQIRLHVDFDIFECSFQVLIWHRSASEIDYFGAPYRVSWEDRTRYAELLSHKI